ncbi:hypothetical protein CERZMDRAFT_96618 [Cercospora zeae-maydis SCOH1-5]|uniref:Translation initiation factor 3 N-terminal domain-containing protein n=1 Tax=Cercospora zeae-maydis SCOH1-5 TaxID=717836 RepID=A0A6A6FI35_9PEZI|nr:hypothetical protein CERZMDRAFT_96618 [Cercospora zeae-maydis SCOH1-5]
MAHFKHSSTTVHALYQVFVLPALSRPAYRQSFLPLQRHQPHSRSIVSPFSTSSRCLAKTRAAEERAQKWNEEITAQMVQIVDPETNRLLEPMTPFDVLKNLDTKTHRLVQLVPDDPGNPDFIPACKIVNKKDMYESEKRAKEVAKEKKRVQKVVSGEGLKTLEINWAIDQKNDLMHRLERLKAFLAEGRRVDVICAAKKRGRKASIEECEAVVEKILAAVESVEGARVREEMTGKLGGFCQWTFQGTPMTQTSNSAGGEEKDEAVDADAEKA